MIIGEKECIIGKHLTCISEFSISVYFYIVQQKNYILTSFKQIFFKIIPTSISPPNVQIH